MNSDKLLTYMKNKILSIFYILMGIFFILYDVILICLSHGTFFDILISFSHIWSFLGLLVIFCGVFRIKKNKSLWNIFGKNLKIGILSFIFVGFVIFFVNLCFILNPVILPEEDSVDYVILLGGGIDKNGQLPELVQNRVKKTEEYLNKHLNSICVVTGGTLHFSPYAEAPAIKTALITAGIAENRILLEDKALDTIQNLKYSCAILAQNQNCSVEEILNSSVAIVTNRFHLARAQRIAKRLGYKNVSGICAKDYWLKILNSYTREILAYVKLNIRILFTGQPAALTYL